MAEINIEDYKAIQTAMAEAEESNRPFVVPTGGDEVVVVGDVNETETIPHTFRVTFRVPQKTESGVEEVFKTVEYKDVYVTPRQDLKIVKTIGELMPFFNKVTDNSETDEFTAEEVVALVTALPDELIDRIYNIVAEVCGIDPQLRDYIEFSSAVEVVTEFFRGLPGNGK